MKIPSVRYARALKVGWGDLSTPWQIIGRILFAFPPLPIILVLSWFPTSVQGFCVDEKKEISIQVHGAAKTWTYII